MLKFFRRIRQKLLAEGDLKKYLAYGAGEILLVVIGILIALQVNTWNESRIERKSAREYLTEMLAELEEDRKALAFEIKLAEARIMGANEFREFLNSGQLPAGDTIRLVQGAVSIGTFTPFYSYHPTFDELKASGALRLIDKKIKGEELGGYFSRVDLFSDMLYENGQQIKKAYNDRLFRYINPEIKALMWKEGLLKEIDPDREKRLKRSIRTDGVTSDPELFFHLNGVIGIEKELMVWYQILQKENLLPAMEAIREEIKRYGD